MTSPYLDAVSLDFPAPSGVVDGVPANWADPPAPTRTVWGRPAIFLDGVDVTSFRGAHTTIEEFQSVDPFGDGPALIYMPQLTPFDDIRAMFPPGAPVDIYHITPAEGFGARLWAGEIVGYEDRNPGKGIECTGAFFSLDRFIAKPDFYDDELLSTRDTTEHIKDRVNNQILGDFSVALSPITGPNTGIDQRNPGSFEPLVTGWMKELLGKAQVAKKPTDTPGIYDPAEIWTIECKERSPVIRLRGTGGQTHRIQAGAPGVELSLREDYLGSPSAIYGHGVGENNCAWYNTTWPELREWGAAVGGAPPPYNGPYSVGLGSQADIDLIKEELIAQGFGGGLSPVGSPFVVTDFVDGPIGWFKVHSGHLLVGAGGWETLSAWMTFDAIDWTNLFQTHGATTLGRPFYLPIWEDTRTKRRNYDSHGIIIGDNAGPGGNYDPTLPRIEEFVDYGKSNKFAAAIEARRRIENYNEPGVMGDITLTIDPPSGGSRFEIRAGDTINLQYYGDTASRTLHVSKAVHQPGEMRTTLTVDQQTRDYMTIQAIHERNIAAKSDPASRIRTEIARSKMRDDQSPPWDCEAGSGIIPRTAVEFGGGTGGWTIIKFPAARFGRIASIRLELVNYDGSPLEGVFLAAIWGRKVTSDQVLVATGGSVNEVDWDGIDPYWPAASGGGPTALVYAAGRPTSALGWWPNPQGDHNNPDEALPGTGDGVTGVYEDNGSWEFYSQEPPWLWLSVLSSTQGYIQGRLRFADTQPEE